ncbi:MAG: phage tail protein [Solirubrobacteraceae bacterium]
MAPKTVASTSPTTNGAVPDPLGQLTFKVAIPGIEIGRFAECTGLAVEYDVLEYEEGGNNTYVHRLRGRARYPTISLKRGLTHEDALLRWFFNYQKAAQRPTLTVTLVGPTGTPIRTFNFAAAFPIKWTGPETAATAGEVGTESLEVGHAGLV